MLGSDELELLSRFHAGELDAEQTAWLKGRLEREPELARALKRLQRLDEAVLGLKLEASGEAEAVEQAISELAPRRASRVWLALAAGVLVAVGIGIGVSWREEGTKVAEEVRPGPVVPPDAVVRVVDAGVEPSKAPAAAFAPRTMTAGATPMRLEREGHDVWLAPFSHVRLEDERSVRVESGAAVLEGIGRLMLGELVLTVDGLAAGCLEPKECLTRVGVLLTGTQRRAEPQVLKSLELKASKWRAPVAMVLSGGARAEMPGVVAMALAAGDDVQEKPHGAKPPRRFAMFDVPKDVEANFPKDLNHYVMQRGDKIAKCHARALVRPPAAAAKYTAVLSVSERGWVGKVRVMQRRDEASARPSIAECVAEALRDGHLPRLVESEPYEVRYDFEVQPRGDDSGGWMVLLPQVLGEPQLTFMANRAGSAEVAVGDSPSEGPANAKVTVVLFSELECPFCLKAHDTWKQLRARYSGRVRFVFKHRPMEFHPQGILGAKAMAAAHVQGRFWDFSDRAFELKASTFDQLRNIALGLSLDLGRFERDLDSTAVQTQLSADADEAKRLGVKGVPSWFIDGEEVVGAQPFEKLAEKIDAALLRARR